MQKLHFTLDIEMVY